LSIAQFCSFSCLALFLALFLLLALGIDIHVVNILLFKLFHNTPMTTSPSSATMTHREVIHISSR
jgi:hypothetical protein